VIRRALAALALLVPAVAQAGHCYDVKRVVGLERCREFGDWSGLSKLIGWELGGSVVSVPARSVDATVKPPPQVGTAPYSYVAALNDHRALTEAGGEFRQELVFARFYFVGQIDLGPIVSGPQLVGSTAARETVMPTNPDSGVLMEFTVGVGKSLIYSSRARFSIELAPGFRTASFAANERPGRGQPYQVWFMLEARSKLDIWLAPNWSIGVNAGTDLTLPGAYAAGISLGVHLFPYDLQL
jgi:hypothetical protein